MSDATEKKTVLVVDDEAETVDLLTILLEDKGYHAIAASDGDEGVAKAKAESPDLIVLDVQMPHVDGFQAFQQLQQDEQTRGIPVIMLTGVRERVGIGFSAEAMGEFMGSEPTAYIEKPVEPDSLLRAIAEVLG